MTIRFAAIGIDHSHIDGQVNCLLREGAEFVAFHAVEDALASPFAQKFPQAKRVADRRAILEDPSIALILTSAILADRAEISIAAMQHGKDVMSDKPGMTSLAQLADVRRVQQQTGRIFSVCYSEHFETGATVKAGELVAAGAIGEVIHTVGLGPHAIRNNQRPDWFYDRQRYGGILCDIGSHQCEQFLFFSGSLDAEVISATVANRANPEHPGLQDVGDMHLRTPKTTGYVRLDWFTPAGLPTWGDGRLTILGTEGYIELRKYIDIAGRPGKDHLFLVDGKGVTHMDCAAVDLPYGRQLIADIRDRTETAMTQAHCFKAMELALEAQQTGRARHGVATMSDIRTVAVVGGGIGRSHIVEGYKTNPDKFKVLAICDLDPVRMNGLADEFGVERRTASFDELLAMPDLDIIDICTPPMVHYPMVMAALQAGKHAICEKPLVGSLKQVDEVIEEEKRSRGTLMPVFQYRYGDGIEQAKAIIDAGIAGKPYVGTVETLWRRGPDYYTVPWRGKWKTELGGVLMTHAIHPHDIFTYLMGPLRSLYGRVATRVNAIEVEDCISASVELESGALGSFTATLGSADEISRIRLAFENVTFESDHEAYSPGNKPWKILPRNDAAKASIDALLQDWTHVPQRFETQMARYHAFLLGKGPLPVTSADARRALEIVTAFYHSSETHQEVRFPIGKDHPKYASWLPPELGDGS